MPDQLLVQADPDIVLGKQTAFPGDRVWVTVGPVSVLVQRHDDAAEVLMYPLNHENRRPMTTAVVMFVDAENSTERVNPAGESPRLQVHEFTAWHNDEPAPDAEGGEPDDGAWEERLNPEEREMGYEPVDTPLADQYDENLVPGIDY